MTTNGSRDDRDDSTTPTSGSLPKTASSSYQDASEGSANDSGQASGSDGYQSGSGEPAASGQGSGSASAGEGTYADPYAALAHSASKIAEERKRERERRDPAIWLPGTDELDREPTLPERETRFSRDSHARGNPQVSIRLRPLDFERLRRAASLYGVRPTTLARMMVIRGVGAITDAELRKSGDLLKNPDY